VRVLICGGGIGGVTAGLCLERVGVEAVIFESVADVRPLGVGINVLPHAVRVLTALGLAPRLERTGVPTAELAYYSRHGQRIWAEPRGLAAGYRWPQYSIHRGELHLLLLEEARARLGDERVRTGHHQARFRQDGAGVEATFVDRRSGRSVAVERGDLLVGADGIHSRVRAHFYPDEREPRFSGRLLWRAISAGEPFLTGRSMIMAGYAGQKFVAYPIGATADGRALVNWVAEIDVGGERAPVPRDWNRLAAKERFGPAFASWRFDWLDVPALIERAEAVYEFPMTDRDPVERWSFGRVTLLGDAAHPMYPVGSNGASQAILDAAALAEALGHAPDGPSALRGYEAARLGPTAAIVLANRQQGPEAVMQIVEERAPDGFERIEDVISRAELEAVAQRYKQLAGFDRDTLNRQGDALPA
jgi:2-polyprenyl-6-methoxyphenol hydroxylase-like FAD-dependent oxidoreductase